MTLSLLLIILLFLFYTQLCLICSYRKKLPMEEITTAISYTSMTLAFCFSIILPTAIVFILAYFSVYNFYTLIAIIFILSVSILVVLGVKGNLLRLQHWKRLFTELRPNWIFIIVIVVAAILYFGFPTKYMLGGRDPGLYLTHGVNIAKTGSLFYESNELIEGLTEELPGLLRVTFPGFYSPFLRDGEGALGDIVPQFYMLFPSGLAIGYDVGGINGLVRVNAVYGICALLVLYEFARRFFNEKTATILSILIVINPAQLWNVRITQTEILGQLLFFLGIYFFALAWKNNSVTLAILAAIVLGLGGFNRIDNYIFGIGVYLILAYTVLFAIDRIRPVAIFTLVYTILFTLSFWVGYSYTKYYMQDLWNMGTLSGIILINVAFIAVALIACIIRFFLRKKEISNIINLLVHSKYGSMIFCGLFLCMFLFAYFIRPQFIPEGEHNFELNAMVEFTWYTSFTAVLAALWGILKLFQNKKKTEPLYLGLLIFFASMIGYIYRPSITHDHMWACRRWVTVNIPFLLALAAYGIERITNLIYPKVQKHSIRDRKIGIAILSGIVFLYTGYHSLPFLFTPMLKDYDKQYEKVVSLLEPDQIYFFNNLNVSPILTNVYDRNVFSIVPEQILLDYGVPREEVEGVNESTKIQAMSEVLIDPYLDLHGEIYLITEYPLFSQDYEITTNLITIKGEYVQKTVGYYPSGRYDRDHYLYINTIRRGTSKNELIFDMKTFYSENSKYEEGNGYSAVPGNIVFGPYIPLDSGTYEVIFTIKEGYGQEVGGRVDIAANQGQTIFAETSFRSVEQTISLQFIVEDAGIFEFRVYGDEDVQGGEFYCEQIQLNKID